MSVNQNLAETEAEQTAEFLFILLVYHSTNIQKAFCI